ncbi:hypothetical protein [Kitasatospora aureofaciens]
MAPARRATGSAAERDADEPPWPPRSRARGVRARSVRTGFLSAADENVARVYARVGFRPVGTALIAEPA